MVVEAYGSESGKVSLALVFGVGLAEVKSNCDRGGVDCENDRGIGIVIDGSECWGCDECCFEIFLRCHLFQSEMKGYSFLGQIN